MVVPAVGFDSIDTEPPCSSMRLLTNDRPRPAPDSRACGLPRSNFSKTRSWSTAGMPTPVSVTARISSLPLRRASSRIEPPAGVNLIAFEIRLNSACFSRRSSASIAPISRGQRSVFYLVRRREDFRDRRIVIAGGGDSAVDWALSLADIAKQVMVVHRRARFRAAPESAARLQQLADEGRIDLVIPYQLHALEGAAGQLSAVIVADLAGNTRRLDADCLLPFFGLATDLGPVAGWGLALDQNRIQVDPASCATSQPGIFAIGDIAFYPGKLKLILSGFAEAALAAHAIYPLVHPGEALHFEYSTTKGVPGR